jgi:hypothetical protein
MRKRRRMKKRKSKMRSLNKSEEEKKLKLNKISTIFTRSLKIASFKKALLGSSLN